MHSICYPLAIVSHLVITFRHGPNLLVMSAEKYVHTPHCPHYVYVIRHGQPAIHIKSHRLLIKYENLWLLFVLDSERHSSPLCCLRVNLLGHIN